MIIITFNQLIPIKEEIRVVSTQVVWTTYRNNNYNWKMKKYVTCQIITKSQLVLIV
jgi:hypothetical protein